nr:hypothetical protein [Tanacetum cinerariifolium]
AGRRPAARAANRSRAPRRARRASPGFAASPWQPAFRGRFPRRDKTASGYRGPRRAAWPAARPPAHRAGGCRWYLGG